MFYRYLSIFTAILIAAVLVLQRVANWDGVHPDALIFILFFAIMAAFTYRFIRNGSERNPDNFNNYFMGSVVLRFFLCIAVFLVWLILYNDTTLRFAFNFMIFYFLFTGFEIYHIVRNLRPFSKNPQG
jgi:hypothetical protein